MKDANGVELKVGQTVVVSRGRRGELIKARISSIKTHQYLGSQWSFSKQATEEVVREDVRIYYKPVAETNGNYRWRGYHVQIPSKVMVIS